MTEREIYNWFAKDDKFVLIDDVCEAFPNESRESIQNILNRLCEKGTFYKMSTAFGDMYGIDSTVEDEPVTINPSTGSGMGDLLRASGTFDGYEPISKGLIKDAKLKNYGIDEINAGKFKKASYSSDEVVEWMNTISTNREFLTTIKQVALKNLVQNLQTRGLSGDQLLAYLGGLAKIELEEIAKERLNQYKKIEEIWNHIKDGLADKRLLASLSKELVNIVADVEDMTVNGGQLYYSVPIPNFEHFKEAFKIQLEEFENKTSASKAISDIEERIAQRKNKVENDKEKIYEALKESFEPKTASELAEKIGLSVNRVSALLITMVEDGTVIREVKERKAYFSIA